MSQRILIIAILSLGVCACSEKTTDNKIVFVDSLKLFEQFQMKLEYDKVLEREMKQESLLVDSINVLMSSSTDSIEVYKYRKDYYIAEQLFNTKFEKLSGEYTQLVMEKLNQYIKDYASENGFDLVLSGSNGGVLYVDEKRDVTQQLLEYVNSKFKNK